MAAIGVVLASGGVVADDDDCSNDGGGDKGGGGDFHGLLPFGIFSKSDRTGILSV